MQNICFRMPRKRIRTSALVEQLTSEKLFEASNQVMIEGRSVRSVAKDFGMRQVSLGRYVNKRQELDKQGSMELPSCGYYSANKVFRAEHKQVLADYLLTDANFYYGLTPKEIRKLAIELADANH